MKPLATGEKVGQSIVVSAIDEANRLYNKSLAGVPDRENRLILHPSEAAYCCGMGWLKLAADADAWVTTESARTIDAVAHMLVYQDLRERGMVVQCHGDEMTVWHKGDSTKKEPWFTCVPFSERRPAGTPTLKSLQGKIAGIVDDDGITTFYQFDAVVMQGDMRRPTLPTMEGSWQGNQVLVTDSEAVAALTSAHVGRAHRAGRMLSGIEVAVLRKSGELNVPESDQDLENGGPKVERVYEAMSSAGVLPRSGFRFGTHLRGYDQEPGKGHARWLVHCSEADEELDWSSISRGVRLAHGVRKNFIIAVADEPVNFIGLSWFRP